MSLDRETITHASCLRGSDVARLGVSGLRARPMRAILSALGIAIGIAAMVGVVGVSASSQARLHEQLQALGTNMLTARSGADLSGANLILPEDSVGRMRMIPGVTDASSTSTLSGVSVYRSRLIDPNATGGILTMAAPTNLLDVVSAKVARGTWLNEATSRYPGVVLGSKAADLLGITTPGTQVWLGNTSFTVLGILEPSPLAEELDNSALIGIPVASQLFGAGQAPTTIYERSLDSEVENVRELIGPTLAPQGATGLKVSRPSDALAAKNAADQTLTTLLAGVGSIALLVGGIGVANTMIISVLERRREAFPGSQTGTYLHAIPCRGSAPLLPWRMRGMCYWRGGHMGNVPCIRMARHYRVVRHRRWPRGSLGHWSNCRSLPGPAGGTYAANCCFGLAIKENPVHRRGERCTGFSLQLVLLSRFERDLRRCHQ